MKKALCVLTLVIMGTALAGSNTVHGFGQDVQATGGAISSAAH